MGQSLLTSSGASDCPYNVGDIYITTLNTNPQDIWQDTTWEKIKDRFLLSSGDTYTLGATGGEAVHTLTINEMPTHNHITAKGSRIDTVGSTWFDRYSTYQSENEITPGRYWQANTLWTGDNQPHNNMPPYLCVNMWIRKE